MSEAARPVPAELHVFEVELTLLPASAGGKSQPIRSGYRPNHKAPAGNEYFMGAFQLLELAEFAPGATGRAILRVVALPDQVAAIRTAREWTIWEGPRHVGGVRMVQELGNDAIDGYLDQP